MATDFERRLVAEALGTGLLLAAIIGSGIMAGRLAGGDEALALLANSLATGAALVAIIGSLGAVSAHLNPLVSLAAARDGALPWREVPAIVGAQAVGSLLGTLSAHAMFGLPLVMRSVRARSGPAQLFAELVATFGLLLVVQGCQRTRPSRLPFAVGAWIVAAFWFTSSTSFANPVVTLARALSDTFTGIRPADVPAFLVGQAAGAAAAILVAPWLFRGVVQETD